MQQACNAAWQAWQCCNAKNQDFTWAVLHEVVMCWACFKKGECRTDYSTVQLCTKYDTEALLGLICHGLCWTAWLPLYNVKSKQTAGLGVHTPQTTEKLLTSHSAVDVSFYQFNCTTRLSSSEKKNRNDYTFWRQLNEEPSITPGCPGCQALTRLDQMCISLWEAVLAVVVHMQAVIVKHKHLQCCMLK